MNINIELDKENHDGIRFSMGFVTSQTFFKLECLGQ